jgi:hypothetical protein
MSWQQPQPPGVLRTIEVPCPRGCGEHWTHPRAEEHRVVDSPEATRVAGNTDEANRIGGAFIRGALEHGGYVDAPRRSPES